MAGKKERGVIKGAVPFAVILLLAAFGCLPKAKKPAETVEQKSYPLRLFGYKAEYKVNTGVAQLEEFLRDPKNLVITAGFAKIEWAAQGKWEKVGDDVPYNLSVLGVAFAGKLTMVAHTAGEEMIFIGQAERYGAIMVLRFRFKPLGDATVVAIRFELEPGKGLVETVGQTVNVAEMMGKAIDAGWAQIQCRFDPSLRTEELLQEGYRGSLYDIFYQAHEGSIWIGAPARKVEKILTDPGTWRSLEQEYGADAAQCFMPRDQGACNFSLKILGFDFPMTSFPGVTRPGEYSSIYTVSSQGLSRMETFLSPDQGGTRVIIRLTYAPQMTGVFSQEAANLAIILMQLPKIIEQVLLNAKIVVEGVG